MSKLWSSPIGLLLITGALVGLFLPFGKLAAHEGIPAIVWAWVISFGAGVTLFGYLLATRSRLMVSGVFLKYFFITAIISYAIPNTVMFAVIPQLGAGYTGLMLTLSPVFTLFFTVIFRMSRPSLLGMLGIIVGFVGAILVAATRTGLDGSVSIVGAALAMVIPLSLALGNVYRSIAWPSGAPPTYLAAGSHLAAALVLAAGALAVGEGAGFLRLAEIPILTGLQMATAAAMFAVFFRLQEVGGPVYLSQIGYVAAAIGLISGIVFLGEVYAWITWLGAIVIVIGVAMTTKAQAAS